MSMTPEQVVADLRRQAAEAARERAEAAAELRAILAADELDEPAAVAARTRRDDADARFESATSRAAEIEADVAREAATRAAIDAATPHAETRTYDGVARVTREERTYNPEAERRGALFLRDVANALHDPSAQMRLQRHMQEERVELGELVTRDIGTGAVSGLTVPQYLTDLVAPVRRAGRPFANIATSRPLPADGMTVNISRITTGTATAVQASENAGVQETDMDDTLLTVDVRTIAGQQDLSRQALDRAVGVQDVVLADLVSSYNTVLDNQILNGAGTSGTHLGVRNVVGITAVTYTDATPTQAELYPALFQLISQCYTATVLGVTHFVVHPRRFWWLASATGSTFPFFGGNFQGGMPAESADLNDGTIFRLPNIPAPFVLDLNVPTNLGTNEDVIIGVNSSELHLWEDSNAPLFIRAEQPGAGNLTVKLVVYGYSAFTAGRYPAAHGTIGGTGLIAPSGF